MGDNLVAQGHKAAGQRMSQAAKQAAELAAEKTAASSVKQTAKQSARQSEAVAARMVAGDLPAELSTLAIPGFNILRAEKDDKRQPDNNCRGFARRQQAKQECQSTAKDRAPLSKVAFYLAYCARKLAEYFTMCLALAALLALVACDVDINTSDNSVTHRHPQQQAPWQDQEHNRTQDQSQDHNRTQDQNRNQTQAAINPMDLRADTDGDGVINAYDSNPLNSSITVIGDGSSAAPYVIGNVYQLQAISGFDHRGAALNASRFTGGYLYGDSRAEQLSKHYVLSGDIDAAASRRWANGFSPIGDCGADNDCVAAADNSAFIGTMDGRGHSIVNLAMHNRARDGLALFAATDHNAVIKNLKLKATIIGRNYVGGFVGLQRDTEIREVSFSGHIIGNNYLGGISGKLESGAIRLAATHGSVSGNNFIGGIAGSANAELLIASTAATVLGNRNLGGISGEQLSGHINAVANTGVVRGRSKAGGLVGSLADGLLGYGYVAAGAVDALHDGEALGALVGRQSGGSLIAAYVKHSLAPEVATVGEQRGGILESVLREAADPDAADHQALRMEGIELASNEQFISCALGGELLPGSLNLVACVADNGAPLFDETAWSAFSSAALGADISWNFGSPLDYPYLSVTDSEGAELLPAVFTGCVLNESPTDNCRKSILANQARSGVYLGRVNFVMEDARLLSAAAKAGLFTYELVDDFNGLFTIHNRSGGISVARDSTLGDPGSHELTIRVDIPADLRARGDGFSGHLEFAAAFKVELVNHAPQSLLDNYVFASTDEAVFNRALQLAITDADGDPLIYHTNDDRFTIDAQGVIKPPPLAGLAFGAYSFTVNATDPFGATASANVTIEFAAPDTDNDGITDPYDSYPNDPQQYIDGAGSADSPFVISTIYQLQAIAGVDHLGGPLSDSLNTGGWLYGDGLAQQLNANYTLGNNLNAAATRYWNNGKGFQPIGDCGGDNSCAAAADNLWFQGGFDGRSFALRNLHINRSARPGVGLFGGTKKAKLLQVVLDDLNLAGGNYTGGLAGYSINSSYVLVEALHSHISGGNYTGGALGYSQHGYHQSIKAAAEVSGGDHTGGVVGMLAGGRSLGLESGAGLVRGADNVGGVMGALRNGKVAYSHSRAAVAGANYVGGLVGRIINGSVHSSWTEQSVTGDDKVGGFVGEQGAGLIKFSYSHANVTSGGIAGGFVGYQQGGQIEASYSAGGLNGVAGSIGGFVGGQSEYGILTLNYWDSSRGAVSQPNTGSGLSATTEQLQGCGLDRTALPDSSADCAGLFPASSWGPEPAAEFVLQALGVSSATRFWHFGTKDDYPRIRYTDGSGMVLLGR